MSSESEQAAETCSECGLTLTDGDCLTDGCPGPAASTDAAALMGDGSESEPDSRPDDEDTQAVDPAEEYNQHQIEIRRAAEESIERADPDEYDFATLSDANRKRVMNGQQPVFDDEDEGTSHVDASSDPTQLDWRRFVSEYGFDNAGEGDQDRHTSRTKLLLAFEVDEKVAGNPESFLQGATATDETPLVKQEFDRAPSENGAEAIIDQQTPQRRYFFREEVLA